MKVLLILLSGQHVPNLQSVEAVEPDLVAYVETNEMKKKGVWQNLENALKMRSAVVKSQCFTLENETSIKSAKRLFFEIKERYKADELTVNLTGGTKLMSIAAYDIFRESDARLIYKPFRFVDEFVDIGEDSAVRFESKLSVRQFLNGYGYDILASDQQIERHLAYISNYVDIAAYLVQNHEKHEIRGCLANIKRIYGDSKGDLIIDESDRVFTNDDVLRKFLIGNLGEEPTEEGNLHGTLKKHIVKFLTGEWLEVFLWGLLSKYASDLGVSNPLHSVRVRKISSDDLENELDVAFLAGDELCIIECKTGRQLQDVKGTLTLHKIKAIKEMFGALKIRTYLITTSDNIRNPDGSVKKNISSRAREYGCKLVTGITLHDISDHYKQQEQEYLMTAMKKTFDL